MDKTYSEKYRKLGQNIAYYRKDRGYTQMQLAELLDIDRSHMSAIEIANRGVSLDIVFKICDILNLSENTETGTAALQKSAAVFLFNSSVYLCSAV